MLLQADLFGVPDLPPTPASQTATHPARAALLQKRYIELYERRNEVSDEPLASPEAGTMDMLGDRGESEDLAILRRCIADPDHRAETTRLQIEVWDSAMRQLREDDANPVGYWDIFLWITTDSNSDYVFSAQSCFAAKTQGLERKPNYEAFVAKLLWEERIAIRELAGYDFWRRVYRSYLDRAPDDTPEPIHPLKRNVAI